MTKRFISLFLALLIMTAVIPAVSAKAAKEETDGYNAEGALAFAEDNWDSGKGLCAEFASDCLRRGGVDDTYERRVVNLYNRLLENGWGKSYKLKLTGGNKGSVLVSENEGKVKPGDPVFYYCNKCKSFEHVVIANGANSEGYLVEYAHNTPHDGKTRAYTYYHCGGNDWTLYSIRMNEGETLYGGRTSVAEPKITDIRNTANGVFLEWTEIKDATSYKLFRRSPRGSWELVKNLKGTYFTDENVKNGDRYIYTVRACKGKEHSAYYYGKPIMYLDKMHFNSIANTNNNSISLTWDKNVEADGYALYRSDNNGSFRRIATISNKNTVRYVDKNVKSGVYYRYRLLATTKNGYVGACDYSGIGLKFLAAPQDTKAANTNEGISLFWDYATGATSYRVYRRGAGESYWSYIDTVKGNNFVDPQVESSSYYRYTVRSSAGRNFGGFDKDGKVLRCVGTPVLTGVKSEKEGITINWNEVPGAMGYFVYHKAPGDKYWTYLDTVKGETEFLDTAVTEGTTYNYTVKAFYGNTRSGYDTQGLMCEYNH